MHQFLGYIAGNGVFGQFWTFMGAIWAPGNALTILVIMRNFHYLINKDEAKWEAVVSIIGEWSHMKDLGLKDNKMIYASKTLSLFTEEIFTTKKL